MSVETENALKDGVSKLNNVRITGTLSSKEGIYTNELFLEDGNSAKQTFNYSSLNDITKVCTWMSGWVK